MATAKIKVTLPGLVGYASGELRLALRLHSIAQDGALVVGGSNLSLTPDAIWNDTYWTEMDGSVFASTLVCEVRVTEGVTVRGSGYVLMDNTTGIHVVVGQPYIATIDGTQVDADVTGLSLVINSTAPELQNIDEDGNITIHRGDYTVFRLTLGSLVGRTGEKLIFTIKETKPETGADLDDATAILQVTETSGAVLLNQEVHTTNSDGSVVVIDEATGETEFTLKNALTTALPLSDNFYYDVAKIRADGEPITVAEALCTINADVGRRSTIS